MDARIMETAGSWLGEGYDEATKEEVRKLMAGDPKQLEEAFYKTLEFGTGGLRGIMGAGTNRMNRYTVAMATQGFANYLKKCFAELPEIKVSVCYDCRHHSKEFARITAEIFEANGMHVYLFSELRPTPELSYSIRHFGCQGGVMVTASHNPKIYNGYKAYWDDGAQVIAPHDTNIIKEVAMITSIGQVKFTKEEGCKGFIEMVGKELDDCYLRDIATLRVAPESVERHKDICVVYTPLHGCGVKIIPRALTEMGLTNLHLVEEQCVNDGDFPTVDSPNPGELSALKMAFDLADKVNAEMVLASDPDADRIAIGVRNDKGEMVQLSGNQANSIMTYYMLRRWTATGRIRSSEKFPYTVKTIVTTDLIARIAERFGVKCYDVLTGFKNIAEVVKYNEGKGVYVIGGEESFGMSVGEFVRDKDSVIACELAYECAAWCADNNMTVWGLLQMIFREFGEYKNWLRTYTYMGIEGKKMIDSIVEGYRTDPPKTLAGSPVVSVKDYANGTYFAPEVELAKSNVLQFTSEDGTMVSVRPSGTEPKIKFYFEIRCMEGEDVETKAALLDKEFEQHGYAAKSDN